MYCIQKCTYGTTQTCGMKFGPNFYEGIKRFINIMYYIIIWNAILARWHFYYDILPKNKKTNNLFFIFTKIWLFLYLLEWFDWITFSRKGFMQIHDFVYHLKKYFRILSNKIDCDHLMSNCKQMFCSPNCYNLVSIV